MNQRLIPTAGVKAAVFKPSFSMSYITVAELKSVVYQYQLDQITDNDPTIVDDAIAAAEDEVLGYLRPGPKGLSPAYDTDYIFSRTGPDRSSLLLQIVKTIALWHVTQLGNVDMDYDKVKDRYDRAITWLKGVNRGDILPSLPLLSDSGTSATTTGTGSTTTVAQTPNDYQVARMGSRPKFNHE